MGKVKLCMKNMFCWWLKELKQGFWKLEREIKNWRMEGEGLKKAYV